MHGNVTDDIGAGAIARWKIDLGKITKTYQEAGPKVCGAKDPPPGKQGKHLYRFRILTYSVRFGNTGNLFLPAG